MLFLAHFSHTPYNVVLTWPLHDIYYRVRQAVALHNEMNKVPDKDG